MQLQRLTNRGGRVCANENCRRTGQSAPGLRAGFDVPNRKLWRVLEGDEHRKSGSRLRQISFLAPKERRRLPRSLPWCLPHMYPSIRSELTVKAHVFLDAPLQVPWALYLQLRRATGNELGSIPQPPTHALCFPPTVSFVLEAPRQKKFPQPLFLRLASSG